MGNECITVERHDATVTITMSLPERRNALGIAHLTELLDAFCEAGESDASGVVLAARGPVFSAGHDLAEMAGSDLGSMRRLLDTCADLMITIQSIPQVVVARVHALATAAGCQLVATCDLAVAARSAGFRGSRGPGRLVLHHARWWRSGGRCPGSGRSRWRSPVT